MSICSAQAHAGGTRASLWLAVASCILLSACVTTPPAARQPEQPVDLRPGEFLSFDLRAFDPIDEEIGADIQKLLTVGLRERGVRFVGESHRFVVRIHVDSSREAPHEDQRRAEIDLLVEVVDLAADEMIAVKQFVAVELGPFGAGRVWDQCTRDVVRQVDTWLRAFLRPAAY